VTGQIPVEHRIDGFLHAMDEVRTRLKAGKRVHIFPELTRCPPGFAGLQAFSAAPFLAAIQEDAWIMPVAISGTDDVWPKGRAELTFRSPIVARSLPLMRAREFATADALRNEVHRQLGQVLGTAGLP